jgi:acetoin utilization protein AcuB
MDDSLALVQNIFSASLFHHVLVTEDDRLVGIVSDRDLLKALSPFVDTMNERMRDRATLERKVHQIMSREIISLKPNSSIVSAIGLFNRHRVSCLPVVDEQNMPVGIVSWRDVLRYVEGLVKRKKEQ